MFSTLNSNSSITPRGVFTPRQTRAATNAGIAQAQMAFNPYEIRKGSERPGVSAGAGLYRDAAAGLAQARAAAANASAMIPFSDASANAGNFLSGQMSQDQEGQAWGDLGTSAYSSDMQQRARDNARALALLQSLLNG